MKKKMSILAALVLAVVVTGYSVSGTYAKYTSTFTGSTASARVAKWAFEMKDTDGNYVDTDNSFTFDLFKTIKDSNGTAETDVYTGLIAPGTSGEFDMYLKNASEVNAEYTVEYTVNKAGVPLEFSIDGTTWTDDLSDVTTPVSIGMNGAEDHIKIQWRWSYEQADVTTGDTTDTALGAAGTATPEVTAKIVVTQVE